MEEKPRRGEGFVPGQTSKERAVPCPSIAIGTRALKDRQRGYEAT